MATAMDVEAVFSQGQQGYHTFRIPALVYHDGVFLAFCEARKDTYKDWGPMDIVLKRGMQQEGDGLEWSDVQTVCFQAVEIVKKDGGTSLCLNIRTLGPHARRQQSFSEDDGLTFSPGQLVDELVEPCKTGPMMPTVKNYGGCQGSVVAATPPSDLRPPEGSEFETWVLFANPNHLSLRENMSLKVSKDGCRTWSPGLVLHQGPSAYSDLATYEEGGAVKVACLFEKGQEHPYETISLLKKFSQISLN